MKKADFLSLFPGDAAFMPPLCASARRFERPSIRLSAANPSVNVLRDHRDGQFCHGFRINCAVGRICPSRLPNRFQKRFRDGDSFRRIEHRRLRNGQHQAVCTEHQPELHRYRFKVVAGVWESAAADHRVAKAAVIRLCGVFITVAVFLHFYAVQRQRPVDQPLERRRHAVAVERKAEQQQIAGQDIRQNLLHIVLTDTAAAAHTGEAPPARLNHPVNRADGLHLDRQNIAHAVEKSARQAHGVALFPFGRTVDEQDFHEFCSPFCRISSGLNDEYPAPLDK